MEITLTPTLFHTQMGGHAHSPTHLLSLSYTLSLSLSLTLSPIRLSLPLSIFFPSTYDPSYLCLYRYVMCGAVPVRASARGREMFVLCGWTGDDDWLGEIPADDMPAVLNAL